MSACHPARSGWNLSWSPAGHPACAALAASVGQLPVTNWPLRGSRPWGGEGNIPRRCLFTEFENGMTNDTDRLIAVLEGMNPLRESVLRAAIDALHLPRGSRGLDIGCGLGDQAILLAAAIGPTGHVTGLDISWPLVDCACRRASELPQAGGIAFQQGDMMLLPYAAGCLRLGLERRLCRVSCRRPAPHPERRKPSGPPRRRDGPARMDFPTFVARVRIARGKTERKLLALLPVPG